jgi:glycerol-3-phosphate dehydrogenase subunit B
MSEVVVVGAGLAGLVAACVLAQDGVPVRLVSKGGGGLPLSPGTVDVWGAPPAGHPFRAVRDAPDGHPYRAIGETNVRRGVAALLDLVGADWFDGDVDTNALLPTALGALRPTALFPPSMGAGRPEAGARWTLVGFDRVKDFYPALAAGNLNRTELPGGGRVHAVARAVALPTDPALAGADASAMVVARAFDRLGFAERVAKEVKPLVREADAVGVPAVLGSSGRGVWEEFSQAVGRPVFEVTSPPPCLPGFRLEQALLRRARRLGVRLVLGAAVTAVRHGAGRVVSVTTAAAGSPKTYPAEAVVYCPGGFESGGLELDSRHRVVEPLFGLPLTGLAPTDVLIPEGYSPAPAVFAAGVLVDGAMRPVDSDGEPVYRNLHAAGGLLGGSVRWADRCGEGVALGSAAAAAHAVLEGLK